jgi:hypothetical protein
VGATKMKPVPKFLFEAIQDQNRLAVFSVSLAVKCIYLMQIHSTVFYIPVCAEEQSGLDLTQSDI